MTTSLWCLLVVAVLPYLLAGIGGFYRNKQLGEFDNNNPRSQYSQLQGVGAHVWAAQQNAWEALGLFTAVVVIVHLAGVHLAGVHLAGADASSLATASLVFLATRILHAVFYIADLATLRSASSMVGLASCAYMLYLAASV